ncbi:unnamed protein product [Psylliodes chrysocephalus]|uniref:Uncharacterized protein n=1 Tax=Psylliodes chrysocephalus TaxID=3402493 RepID=A0A9P0G9J2_9CUCU|nr:unnamed protein product [Psylliodes chrysocephala]
MHKISESEIWLANSATKKTNNQHLDCINCTNLALKLGSKLCRSLPAFHAFTNFDYMAAFYNKGKVKPFRLFLRKERYQTVFASLTDEADIFINEKMDTVQEFTANDYLKPTRFIGDQTPLIIEETTAKESDDEESSEVEDQNFSYDESDFE